MKPLNHHSTQRPPHAIDCTCTMNRGLYLFAGIIIGILLTTAYLYLTAGDSIHERRVKIDGITMFAEPGNTMPFKSFEVFQVLPNGAALAYGTEKTEAQYSFEYEATVYLEPMDGVSYYDNLDIKVPVGKTVRQTGIFRYETMSEITKTIPIIRITDR